MQEMSEEDFSSIQTVARDLYEADIRFEICGKIRRGILKDVESGIIVAQAPTTDIHKILARWEPATNYKHPNTTLVRVNLFPIFVYSATEENWGAALFFYTAHGMHKSCVCSMARSQGLKLSLTGVWQGKHRIAGKTEEQIYACLGLPYYPPTERYGPIKNIEGEKKKKMRANSIEERKKIYRAIVKVFSERQRGTLPVKRSEIFKNLDEYMTEPVLNGHMVWLQKHGLATNVKGGWLANALPPDGICWEHGKASPCQVCRRKVERTQIKQYIKELRKQKGEPNVILGACGSNN